ncbi:MAG: hypothetical protein KF773_18050 [Deltaproteobacteria bacterium]|nr:hypothetical protein [Deltaproteobacteria bacterium]
MPARRAVVRQRAVYAVVPLVPAGALAAWLAPVPALVALAAIVVALALVALRPAPWLARLRRQAGAAALPR